MGSLFQSRRLEPLHLPDADVSYLETMHLGASADVLMGRLIDEIEWRHEDITLFGKTVKQPRLTAWYGDQGMTYSYSNLSLDPHPWTPLLADLKARVEAELGTTFNSALLNLYRGDRDSIGFHADNERELGPKPLIASLSLGQIRTFILKHKRDKSIPPCKIQLGSGSLLVMAGNTQSNWVHGIEKESKPCGPRINITFRTIYV